jgi:predicted nucleic acid-binding protein
MISMPEDRIFVDTNILIYAYDVTAGQKHAIASDILADLWNARLGVVSTQVLQEFFVNVVQKIQRPVDIRLAKDIVKDLLKWHVVVNNGESILEAIDIHERYGYSFWDAMIIAAAIKGGAAVLMTEDLQDGQTIGGVSIKNPFD